MKTTSKIGSVALAAVLAMGMSMPAFAINGSDENVYWGHNTENGMQYKPQTNVDDNATVWDDFTNIEENGQSASTTIMGRTYVPQLNVTVPLAMEVAVDAGTGNIMFPTPDAYRIKSTGDANVKIIEVTGEEPEAAASGPSFVFGQTQNPTDNHNVDITVKASKDLKDGAKGKELDGTIATLASPLSTTPNTVDVEIPQATLDIESTPENEFEPGELFIQLEGKVNWKKDFSLKEYNNTAFEIAKVVYTVAVNEEAHTLALTVDNAKIGADFEDTEATVTCTLDGSAVSGATNIRNAFTFESSDEDLATVDNKGKVTPVAEASGTVTITVTSKAYPTLSKTIQIEITDEVS